VTARLNLKKEHRALGERRRRHNARHYHSFDWDELRRRWRRACPCKRARWANSRIFPKGGSRYIGACTGAKLENLRMAASVLRAAKTKAKLIVGRPACRDQQAAEREGTLKVCWDRRAPRCSPILRHGAPLGPAPARREHGGDLHHRAQPSRRMGAASAQVYSVAFNNGGGVGRRRGASPQTAGSSWREAWVSAGQRRHRRHVMAAT